MRATTLPGGAAALARSAAFLGALAFVLLVAWTSLTQPLVSFALLGAAGVLAGAVTHPEIATYAVVFLLYSNIPVVLSTFHGVPKAAAAAFPLLLLLPLARDLVTLRRPPVITTTLLLLLLLLAAMTVSAAFSRAPGESLGAVATFALEGVALYLLLTNVLRTRRAVFGAVWALVLAGLLMSAVPLFQQVTGTLDNDYGGLAQVDGGGFRTGAEGDGGSIQRRLAGPVGETNRYAQAMLVLLPLAMALALGRGPKRERLLALACGASILLGFALAFSRGGALGLACVFLAMLALRVVDVRKALWSVGGLLLLVVAVPQYGRRLATLGESVQVLDSESAAGVDGAVRRRVTEMLAAVRLFRDYPVLGVGPGLFKQYSEEYGNKGALRRIEGGRRAHSLYLETAAELGAVGLTLFLAAVAATLAELAAARRACLAGSADPGMLVLVNACILALVAYLSTAMFLHLSYMRYLYVILALAGSVAWVTKRSVLPRSPLPLPDGGAPS